MIYGMASGSPKPVISGGDDIDLTKRTVIVRRLKGSTDSSHYLERDEHKALGEGGHQIGLRLPQ
jgi:hypothetical protein